MLSQIWVTHFECPQFTSRKPDFVCCSSTATMPVTKRKAPPKDSSVAPSRADIDIEVFTSRLWTVSKDNEFSMSLASPPEGKCECYGPFWDVRACGDHGGPPANKVRECDEWMTHSYIACVRCVCVVWYPLEGGSGGMVATNT